MLLPGGGEVTASEVLTDYEVLDDSEVSDDSEVLAVSDEVLSESFD